MELCAGLLIFLIVLGFIALLGHGIWVFVAVIFRALLGGDRPRERETPFECPACERFSPGWSEHCLNCGLLRHSPATAELTDLAALQRQLERFERAGTADAGLLEKVQALAYARKRLLLGHAPAPEARPEVREPAVEPVRVEQPTATVATTPDLKPWQQLQALMLRWREGGSLSADEHAQALLWYQHADAVQLSALSAPAQLQMARLLEEEGWLPEALRTLRRFLQRYPQAPEFGPTALRAARLAMQDNQPNQAEWFVQRSLSAGTLSAENRRAAEALLESLRQPAEVLEALPVLEVVPVEPAPVAMPSARRTVEAPVLLAASPAAVGLLEPPPAAPARVVAEWTPPSPAPEPPPPPPPRRPFTEMLSAFMEEKNILWGELLGGLLIVGCSIALVISLWSKIEQIPYFPFIIFGTITAALYGAGLYTFHHWKLESTSRGLLIIGTLLVPLNFLIMAGLHRETSGALFNLLELGVGGVYAALFVALMSAAGRVLFADWRWPFVLGVLGTSACQLLVAPLVGPAERAGLGVFVLLSALPALCHAVSVGRALRQSARSENFDDFQARTLLAFLGITSFALAVSLGFVAYRGNDLFAGLQRLSLLIGLAGVPLLLGGVRVQRAAGLSPGMQATGTGVALTGMFVMLSAVGFAWPDPGALVLVCLVNFAALTALAFRRDVPYAHAAALPCLALAYLLVVHAILGDLEANLNSLELFRLLFEVRSGTALAGFVVVAGLAALGTIQVGLRQHAAYYALGSAVAAAFSLVMVTLHGLESPLRAVIIYTLYGCGCLVLNFHWRRPPVSYIGLTLLLGASLWWLADDFGGRLPVWALVLAVESMLLAGLRAFGDRPDEEPQGFADAEPAGFLPLRAFLAGPLGNFAGFVGALALLAYGLGWRTAASWNLEPAFLHACTVAALAASAFLLAWAYRAVPLTWVGSGLALAGLIHVLAWETEAGVLSRSLLPMALLSHATLCGLAVFSIQASRSRQRPEDSTSEPPVSADALVAIFAEPLAQSAILTSIVSVGFLALPERGAMLRYTLSVTWLAACWLVVALMQRWAKLFAAFQAALSVAVLYGVTAWLEGQPWVTDYYPQGLWDPRSLQAFGLGLAVLSLGWVVVRLVLRSKTLAQEMLNPGWPTVDQAVLGGLVIGQLLLATVGLSPVIARELTPVRLLNTLPPLPVEHVLAWGAGAWWWLGLLTVALVLALWERWPAWSAYGLVLLAVTVPVLVAGHFENDVATAPALRWGLALCFLLGSVLAWVRVPLFRAAGSAGINVDDADRLTVNVRVLLIALCIVPILGLSGAHLLIRSGGEMLLRPAPGTFFDLVKSPGSHGVPLALLAVALVGHALRERKPSYAFSAGLLVNLAVMGGYALSLRQLGLPFDSAAVVRMLQLGSVAAALWALGWLGTRRWVAAWREDETPAAAPLMSAQLGLIAAGLAALLGGGVLSLTAWVPAYPLSGSEVFYLAAPWAEQVGAPLGWLPLVLGVLALVYRERQRQSWPDAVMLSGCGLALAALTACSIERAFGSSWGYRSLMLGWSTVALCCAGLAVWLAARREREAGLGGNAEALARGVLVAGLLTLVLALKAALIHHDYLWAAGALFLASTASAAVAVWRREEAWAFASGLGLNLVASLVVWHIFRDTRVLDWWWYLVQANSAACGLAALLWLAARKRFYGDAELRLASSPLLAVQILLGIVGNLPTLGLAFLTLLVAPDPGNTARIWLSEVGEALGWLSLGLPMIAALWYTSQATPRSRLPVGIAFALGVGVLGACGLSRWDTLGEWYGFHFLMVAWSTTALATLGLGLATVALQLAQSQSNPEGAGDGEPQTLMPWIVRLLVFPTRQIQVWVEVIGWLVVVLALRGAGSDDGGAFWSPGAALSVVFVTVGLALWARSPRYVWQSGLLLNLAGNLWLLAYGPFTLTAFIAVNVVCLGVGSVFWSALELALRTNALAFHLRGRVLGFNYVAALFGLIGLTMLTTLIVTANYSGVSLELAGTLTVAALFVTGLAIVLGFWDAQAPVGVGGLYLLGLEAVILGLHALHIAVAPLHGIAAATLAGYVLLTALLAWACVHGDVASLLKLPERTAPLNHLGLLVWQALTAVAVLVRSVQLVIDLAHPEQRWLGPLSVTLLTPVGVLLCASFRQRNNFDLRHLTFLLAGLGLVEWSWAFLPAEIAVPWLHRNVLLMTMVAVAAVGCAALRRRLLDAWSQAAGNAASCFGGLAGLALVVVLGQEAMLFDRSLNRAPTEVWAALLVVAALAGVIVAVLCFALRPESDPLQLSEERRTAYVYAAEVLAALLFAHLRLTMPWLFNPLMAQYWTFGVMALAFAGVGLAELFKRRGLQVLAGPLQNTGIFLPLLPLLALWLKLPAAGLSGVVEPAMPGSRLLFGYFEVMPWAWHKYALLWCLACLLYSLVALSRLSFRFAVVAALAGNFALWSLWQYAGLPFFAQPQLWLIPLGLILLASEHLNRANLQPVQSLSLRYAGLGLIYLSSTADLFLKGLGDLWLSLALMVLSVVGVFAGIVLRIRAYLFLGFGFLFLVIFSMIWHAAVDLSQTWVWWATGIVLGVAILALFAVFEKRRNDVLRMVEQIKQWG